jgi:LPXTG-motif cell wall-anchored protein
MEKLGSTVRALLAVPKQAESVLTQIEKGEVVVRLPELEARAARLEVMLRRLTDSVVFGAFLLGGVQLAQTGPAWGAAVLLAGAAISLGWMLLTGRRR